MNSPEARMSGNFAPTDSMLFVAASGSVRKLSLFGKSTVNGKGAGALDHDDQGGANGQKVIFVAFPLLCAVPVSKQTEMPVDQRDGHHHIARDSTGGDTAEESVEKPDAVKEFRADCQK